MTEKKFAPETAELAEEALEQIAGGTVAVTSPVVTPAVLFKQNNGVVNVLTGDDLTIKPAVLFKQDEDVIPQGRSM